MTREPRITEAELAALHGVVVLPDATADELAGSTVLLLTDAELAGRHVDDIDTTELDLPDERVINLAHLVKWAVAKGTSR